LDALVPPRSPNPPSPTALSTLSLHDALPISITVFFHYMTGKPWHDCLLNAIPFSVISSAIAIPSVASLTAAKKEFIVYESSFSEIEEHTSELQSRENLVCRLLLEKKKKKKK